MWFLGTSDPQFITWCIRTRFQSVSLSSAPGYHGNQGQKLYLLKMSEKYSFHTFYTILYVFHTWFSIHIKYLKSVISVKSISIISAVENYFSYWNMSNNQFQGVTDISRQEKWISVAMVAIVWCFRICFIFMLFIGYRRCVSCLFVVVTGFLVFILISSEPLWRHRCPFVTS